MAGENIGELMANRQSFLPQFYRNFFRILFAVHVIQVGQRVDVLVKYFRHINGKHSNKTLPSPAGTLRKLMPSTGIFAVNHHLDREHVSFHHVKTKITWKLSRLSHVQKAVLQCKCSLASQIAFSSFILGWVPI